MASASTPRCRLGEQWTLRSIIAYRTRQQQRADRFRRAARGRRRRSGHLPQPADLAGIAAAVQQWPLQRPDRRLLSRRQCRQRLRRVWRPPIRPCRGSPPRPSATSIPRPGRSSAISPTISPTSSAISIGGRYTWDKRTRDRHPRQSISTAPSPFFGGNGTQLAHHLGLQRRRRRSRNSRRAPRSASSPTTNNTIYASYSRGFKGGGFDPRGLSTAAPDLNGNGTCDAQRDLRLLPVRSGDGRPATSSATRPLCSIAGCASPSPASMPIIRTCRCPARSAR